jgi:hypothetical protein
VLLWAAIHGLPLPAYTSHGPLGLEEALLFPALVIAISIIMTAGRMSASARMTIKRLFFFIYKFLFTYRVLLVKLLKSIPVLHILQGLSSFGI